jgi:hypothetical protein
MRSKILGGVEGCGKEGAKTRSRSVYPSIDGVLMGCLFRPGFVKVLL